MCGSYVCTNCGKCGNRMTAKGDGMSSCLVCGCDFTGLDENVSYCPQCGAPIIKVKFPPIKIAAQDETAH